MSETTANQTSETEAPESEATQAGALKVVTPDTESNEEKAPSMALPHNLEAEQELLGAILLDNSIFEQIDDSLQEEHFFDPAHGRIFAAIRNLVGRGNLANPITLKSYFTSDKSLASVDIETYLNELAESVLSLADAPQYEREIRQCYLRRKLIKIADELTTKARAANLEADAENLIEEAEQHLYNLAENNAEGGLAPFAGAVSEALSMAEQARKTAGGISGLGTGLKDLDEKLGGLQKSDLIVLAGRPGMGKTALATNMAFHAATTTATGEEPQYVAFFSLEMSSEQLANRILSSRIGIPSDEIRRGKINQERFTDLVRTAGDIENAQLLLDDSPAISVSQIYSRARRMKRTYGLGLIVVDYLQLLSPPLGQKPENRVQEISGISRMLKAVAKELNVPVLAISQLSRAVEQREDKRPNLADLRESGSIEQDADVVLFIYREEYYLAKSEPDRNDPEMATKHDKWQKRMEKVEGKAEILISKQRHGPTGTIEVSFDAQHTQFINYRAENHLPERYE